MLCSKMSPPVILASKTSKFATSRCKAAGVITEIPNGSMAFLVTEEIFRKRESNILGSACRCGASEWFRMVFFVTTADMVSIKEFDLPET